MKKNLLFSLVLLFYFLNTNVSFSNDNIVVPQIVNESETENTVLISDKYSISEQDGKFAIIDVNTGKNKLGVLAESIELFDNELPNEYKIKFRNESTGKLLTAYFNTQTEQILITNYNEIYLQSDYLKVKEDTKFGLITKDGHTILMPIFDKVSIFKQDEKEYIYTKSNGQSKLYTIAGEEIPEEELYTISYDGIYAIAADLKSEFKKIVLENKKSSFLSNFINSTQQSEIEEQINDISEVKQDIEEKIEESNQTLENLEQEIVDEVTDVIQENTTELNNTVEEIIEDITNTQKILVGKKYYIIKEKDGLIGLTTEENQEILPIEYDRVNITNLKNPIVLAYKGEELIAFDLLGNVIGQKKNDLIETYSKNKTYTFNQTDNGWDLDCESKSLGLLEFDGTKYKFNKYKFSLNNYNRLIDIFTALHNN